MGFDARVVDPATSDEELGSGSECEGSRGEAGLASCGASERLMSPPASVGKRSSSCPKDTLKNQHVVPGACTPDPECHTPVSVCSNIPAMNIPRFPAIPSNHLENMSMISPASAGSRLHCKRKSTPESEAIAGLGALAADAVARRQSKSSGVLSRRSSLHSASDAQSAHEFLVRTNSPITNEELSEKLSDNKSDPPKSQGNSNKSSRAASTKVRFSFLITFQA